MKLTDQLSKLSGHYSVDEGDTTEKHINLEHYFHTYEKNLIGKTGWLKLPDDVKCSNNVTPAIYINNKYKGNGLMEGIIKNNSDLKDTNFSATNIFMNPFPCIKRNYGGLDAVTGKESTEQYVYPNFEKRMSYFHGRADLEHGKIKKDVEEKLVESQPGMSAFTDYRLEKRNIGACYIGSVSLLLLFLIYNFQNRIK
jgi:hypothetical protein